MVPAGRRAPSPRACAGAPRSTTPSRGAEGPQGLPPASATRAASPRTCTSNEDALKLILEAIKNAGYTPGEQTSSWPWTSPPPSSSTRTAELPPRGRGQDRSPPAEMIEYYADLVDSYPIVSIEDGMAEDDWDGWKKLTDRRRGQGPARRRRPVRHQHGAPADAASTGTANSHPGQGQPDRLADGDARRGDWPTAPVHDHHRHRSGETEDTTIADLAVATERRPDQDRRAGAHGPRRASTTSCCASKRNSTTPHATPDAARSRVSRASTRKNQEPVAMVERPWPPVLFWPVRWRSFWPVVRSDMATRRPKVPRAAAAAPKSAATGGGKPAATSSGRTSAVRGTAPARPPTATPDGRSATTPGGLLPKRRTPGRAARPRVRPWRPGQPPAAAAPPSPRRSLPPAAPDRPRGPLRGRPRIPASPRSPTVWTPFRPRPSPAGCWPSAL